MTRVKCEHGRQKRQCKDCGGASICQHGRQKACCKDCGGASICQHGRRKYQCKECGGAGICHHGRHKYQCKECGGAGICHHGRHKPQCRECGGVSICHHGRQKFQCKECGGSSFCHHGRFKNRCVSCGGSGVCEHGRIKQCCKECGGASFCHHGRQKQSCKECSNCRCTIEGCPRFEMLFAGAQSLLKHMRTQHTGDVKALTKTKELELYQALQKAEVQFEYQHYVPFAGCGLDGETKHAFLDFLIAKEWGYVVIECDEEQHKHYDSSCDPRRDFDTAAAIALGSGHKLRIIRYNPDAFKVDGITRKTSKAERERRLLEVLDRSEPGTQLERLFLFYDHISGATLPEVSAHWDVKVRAVSALA